MQPPPASLAHSRDSPRLTNTANTLRCNGIKSLAVKSSNQNNLVNQKMMPWNRSGSEQCPRMPVSPRCRHINTKGSHKQCHLWESRPVRACVQSVCASVWALLSESKNAHTNPAPICNRRYSKVALKLCSAREVLSLINLVMCTYYNYDPSFKTVGNSKRSHLALDGSLNCVLMQKSSSVTQMGKSKFKTTTKAQHYRVRYRGIYFKLHACILHAFGSCLHEYACAIYSYSNYPF